VSQALTVERLDELERLRAPCAGKDVKLACDPAKHAYVSAILWSAPELIESARRYLELTSALEYLRESERAVLAEWYRQPGEAEYELCPDTILKLARNRGWQGAKS
jgi:hypothetical protein